MVRKKKTTAISDNARRDYASLINLRVLAGLGLSYTELMLCDELTRLPHFKKKLTNQHSWKNCGIWKSNCHFKSSYSLYARMYFQYSNGLKNVFGWSENSFIR